MPGDGDYGTGALDQSACAQTPLSIYRLALWRCHEQRSQYGFRHRQQATVPPKVTSKHGGIFKGARIVARVKIAGVSLS